MTDAIIRVLLVEDNPSDAFMFRALLREAGCVEFQVTCADRLSVALERLSEGGVDVVLLDLLLPDSWNMDTFRKVKAEAPGVPVVVLSGVEDERLAIDAVREGAQDYLTKGSVDGALLARAIRYAVERRRLETQLRQAQKLEALGSAVGGISHEFKNMLMGISGFAEVLEMNLGHEHPQATVIHNLLACVDRASKLIGHLNTFSKDHSSEPRPTDLNELISGCERLLRQLAGEHITVDIELCERPAIVNADPGQIEQVLVNLVINAHHAMSAGGTLTIMTEHTVIDHANGLRFDSLAPGEYVKVSVSDTGTGMDEETIERIFEPFFTTKGEKGGSGLGLAVVYGIVRQHNGYVTAQSGIGDGSTFEVYLPATIEGSTGELWQGVHPPEIGREKILLAEDEETVRTPAKLVLEAHGYTVLCAKDGEEAIDLFRQHADIDIAILDLVMPKAGGKQVWTTLAETRPDIPVLFISGYSEASVHQNFSAPPDMPLLTKPFSLLQLAATVREILD